MANIFEQKTTLRGVLNERMLTESILREGMEEEVIEAAKHNADDHGFWSDGMSAEELLSKLFN